MLTFHQKSVLQYRIQSVYYKYPDIPSLIKFLHCWQQTEYTNIQIYHFSLFLGDSWISNVLDLDLAKNVVKQALNGLYFNIFPNPGNHCEYCVNKECLEIGN